MQNRCAPGGKPRNLVGARSASARGAAEEAVIVLMIGRLPRCMRERKHARPVGLHINDRSAQKRVMTSRSLAPR